MEKKAIVLAVLLALIASALRIFVWHGPHAGDARTLSTLLIVAAGFVMWRFVPTRRGL